MKIVVVILVVFMGAILVIAIASGKSIDSIPWRAPVIVHRDSQPREYWAGVFAIAVGFALAVWIAIGSFSE